MLIRLRRAGEDRARRRRGAGPTSSRMFIGSPVASMTMSTGPVPGAALTIGRIRVAIIPRPTTSTVSASLAAAISTTDARHGLQHRGRGLVGRDVPGAATGQAGERERSVGRTAVTRPGPSPTGIQSASTYALQPGASDSSEPQSLGGRRDHVEDTAASRTRQALGRRRPRHRRARRTSGPRGRPRASRRAYGPRRRRSRASRDRRHAVPLRQLAERMPAAAAEAGERPLGEDRPIWLDDDVPLATPEAKLASPGHSPGCAAAEERPDRAALVLKCRGNGVLDLAGRSTAPVNARTLAGSSPVRKRRRSM